MTTTKKMLLLIVGGLGTAITAASASSVNAEHRLAVVLASIIAALTAGTLVTLFRHRIHPSNSSPSGKPRLIAALGAIVGVVAAMVLPSSSFDPVLLGAITGGLVLVVYWSPALGGQGEP